MSLTSTSMNMQQEPLRCACLGHSALPYAWLPCSVCFVSVQHGHRGVLLCGTTQQDGGRQGTHGILSDAVTLQAFTLRVRPAIDNVESLVDRTKMSIYKTFARLGLPCPVTGTAGHVGRSAMQAEQQ